MKNTLMVAAVALAAWSTNALADNHMSGTKTIPETAAAAGNFNTLLTAAKAAGLDDTLAGPGPFTVFAPTDEAFAALPAGTLDELLLPANKDKLATIVSYHVVPGKVLSTDLKDGQTTATVEGSNVTFDLSGAPKINDADITKADIETSNGVIHVIDAVLMPAS